MDIQLLRDPGGSACLALTRNRTDPKKNNTFYLRSTKIQIRCLWLYAVSPSITAGTSITNKHINSNPKWRLGCSVNGCQSTTGPWWIFFFFSTGCTLNIHDVAIYMDMYSLQQQTLSTKDCKTVVFSILFSTKHCKHSFS